MEKSDLHFFLGSSDLEMKTIKTLLEKEGVSYSDANWEWEEAKASKYGDEIEKVAKEGKTPVLVELTPYEGLPQNTIEIDHHNHNAGRPASILQVCELLGIEPTREMVLIAANDTGMAKGMRAIGASKIEINKIRYMDRAAQGITSQQEAQAEEALNHMSIICGVTVVKCPHSKTATILDRLDRDAHPDVFMFSTSDREINFSGDGLICKELMDKFPKAVVDGVNKDNFCGGSGLGKEGEMASWGGYSDPNEVLEFVVNECAKKRGGQEISPAIMQALQERYTK